MSTDIGDLVQRATVAIFHADDNGVVGVDEGAIEVDNEGRTALVHDFEFTDDLCLDHQFQLNMNDFLSHGLLGGNMQDLGHCARVSATERPESEEIVVVELDGGGGSHGRRRCKTEHLRFSWRRRGGFGGRDRRNHRLSLFGNAGMQIGGAVTVEFDA